jgi:hypothetical protein
MKIETTRNIIILLLLQIAVIAIFASYKEAHSSWPENVTSALYVPEKHEEIEYYKIEGSYQVIYKTASCWPAEGFINTIVDYMSKHGWKRLEEDFLNPGLKHSWARKGTIFEKWGFYLEKGMDVHQWMED